MIRESEANRVVERDLDRLAKALEKVRNTDVIAYFGPIAFGTDDAIKEAIETRPAKRTNLTFLLETGGGYIEVVQRIVDTLRHHYTGTVDFVVPNSAMSAGTVLVMSGDSIWMNYYSVLGPIDPQVEKQGKDGTVRLVPALGYLEKFNELVKKINTPGAATTAELAYLIERFDPAELHEFEQAKELSKTLLRTWLAQYKFKDWTKTKTQGLTVTPAMREKRAEEIAESLSNTKKWHTHGRGISMAVLKSDELKLEIDDFGAPGHEALNKAVTQYNRTLSAYAGVTGSPGIVHRPGMCRGL